MAELKIYNDIQSEDTQNIVQFWGGVKGTSFRDIDEFIKDIPADDETIDIRLHCNGGEVLEGFAIYDKLRSTGKTISAVVEGTCASMATIILLSAQADKRKAYQNAEFLIHEPYMYFSTEHGTADELRRASEEMQRLEDKLTDIYVDRTNADRDTIIAIMKDGKFISADKAQEIGLISTIVAPASAKHTPINHKKRESDMDNETIKVEKSWLQKALSFLGVTTDEERGEPLNMTLTTADGAELTIEREEGDPEVGDKASPDGTHTMSDGKTIIVEDGVIVEIREPEPEEEPADKTPEPDAKDLEISDLKAQIEDLKAQLADATANGKSENDVETLDWVAKAGGLETLKNMASDYTPKKREEEKTTPLNTTDQPRKYDEVLTRILNRKRTY